MQNLLSNALKFTERGGVTIDYGKKEQTFFIQVRDTGKGIPEVDLPFIFDRFFREAKPETEGLGLGLAIVKELVDAMEGTIEVRSEVGKGTAVTVYLKDEERKTLW
ncbi:MAG: ATP-binding protein [Desulfobacterales bacterium]|nr:ATP-binding protein [Desulfobacterales bacterium]